MFCFSPPGRGVSTGPSDTGLLARRVWSVVGTRLPQGRLAYIEGRQQSRTWEAADGSKRRTVEVVAGHLQGTVAEAGR